MSLSTTEFHTVFLDLDDTLYPGGNGIWEAIGDRITQFIVERLEVGDEEAEALRHHYFVTYGTSLNGLMVEHHIDPADYLNYVHDVPLERYLRRDDQLGSMLGSICARRVIFTNADEKHAQRVVELLGIEESIDEIIDIQRLGFCNKPELQAYVQARLLSQAPDFHGCVFVDDMPRNLAPAAGLGMTTVLVGHPPLLSQQIFAPPTHEIPTIHHLLEVLPTLRCDPSPPTPPRGRS